MPYVLYRSEACLLNYELGEEVTRALSSYRCINGSDRGMSFSHACEYWWGMTMNLWYHSGPGSDITLGFSIYTDKYNPVTVMDVTDCWRGSCRSNVSYRYRNSSSYTNVIPIATANISNITFANAKINIFFLLNLGFAILGTQSGKKFSRMLKLYGVFIEIWLKKER